MRNYNQTSGVSLISDLITLKNLFSNNLTVPNLIFNKKRIKIISKNILCSKSMENEKKQKHNKYSE